MKQTTISIFIILFSITLAYGQQDTLVYKYRRMAVDYQQSIKMAQHNLEGAESMVEVAESDYLPKVDLNGDYSYIGVPIQLAPDASGNPGAELQNKYSLGLGITQPIYAGGYLKNTKGAAKSKAEVMRDYLSLSKQDVMINSDIYYWNAVAKKEKNSLLVKYRDAIGEFQQVIQDRVDDEIAGMNELYQAKVRYDDAEYDVLKTEKNFAISVMELNRSVGLPIRNPATIADSLLTIEWLVSQDNLTEKALEQRPEISMIENKISMNTFEEKVTASKYNPKLGVGVGGNWGAPSPGLTTDADFNYMVQVRLAIPLYYWGRKKKDVFASRQKTEVAKLEMDQAKDMITLQVESSHLDLQRSQKQLDYSFSSLENASKNVEVMLDRYTEGLSSVLEVLDSQLFWQKSYLNYIEAKFELNMAYSTYKKAMGELKISQ